MSQETTTSRAVERALSIIELVAESQNPQSNADLSRRLKIPKSSASYVLRVLENRGYLRRDEDGRYRLGLKLLSLTSDSLTHTDIREIAKPVLQGFLKKTRLPEAHLAILDNGRAVYIEKVENERSFIKMDIWVGHRLPVHTTAIGKVLVSGLAEEEIKEILRMRGMEKKTRKSILSARKFLAEIKRVRANGFAIDDEENSEEVRCLAAPIFDAHGKVVAALGASSTILQIDKSRMPELVNHLKKCAEKVSRQIGFNPK